MAGSNEGNRSWQANTVEKLLTENNEKYPKIEKSTAKYIYIPKLF